MKAGEFWDEVAGGAPGLIEAEARRLIEALIPAESLRGRAVLDAGCGAGEYSAVFRALGARVAGVDIGAGGLHLAAARVRGTPFAQASLAALPFRTASFDWVWAWGVLHYVPDPAAALREIGRVLRPSGGAVIHTLRRGLWATLEIGSARLLSHAPRPLQNAILGAGEHLIPPLARLVGKNIETSKPIRQKLQERLFVPGQMRAFTPSELAQKIGAGFTVREVFPPVPDLLRRNLSITVVVRKD